MDGVKLVAQINRYLDGDCNEIERSNDLLASAADTLGALLDHLPAPPPQDGSGIARIAAERQRQIEKEGWTPEHDDEHTDSELLAAAIRYADMGTILDVGCKCPPWPFEPESWKPSDDPIRNLEKAGALIAAEIDRRQRRLCPECGGDLRGSFPLCIDCQVVQALKEGR